MSQQRPSLITQRRPRDVAFRETAHVAAPHEPATAPPKFGPATAGDDLPKPRERSVSKTVRIPVSMLDQLEAICRARKIEFSPLVLFFLEQGLRGTFASKKTEAV
jgi:hypothetical protein